VAALVACSGSVDRDGKGGAAGGGVQGAGDSGEALDCPEAFDRDALPDRDRILADIEALAAAAPQQGGDASNVAWVDGMEARFAALPGAVVERTETAVQLGEVSAAALVATWDGVATDVAVHGALPVSGTVDAPSRYLEPGAAPPADMAGRVAVMELGFDGSALSALREDLLLESDPRGTLAEQAEYRADASRVRPWQLGGVQAQLDAAVSAGAVGVVLLSGLSAELTEALHLDLELPPVPLVLVADEPARRLRDAARVGTGFQAAITVEAERPSVAAPGLRVRLSGATPELVALHAASDPRNVVELGGALTLLALVEALSELPPGCRERDLLVDLSPGWRADHAGAAALAADLAPLDPVWLGVVAHAGAVEHLPDGAVAEDLVRTGLLEPRFVSIDAGEGLAGFVVDTVAAEALDRAWVLDRPAGFGAASALAGLDAPVVERHSGPWTLPFAERGATAVDPTAIRSDAAWLGALLHETGAAGAAELR
jgi:hypothetical protein